VAYVKRKTAVLPYVRFSFITAMLLFLGLCECVVPRSGLSAEDASSLRIGFTGSVYQDVTNTDIKAAVGVLIQKVAWKQFGKGESHYYETLSEMAMDLKNRKTEVLAMPVDEFIELRKRAAIVPILVTSSDSGFETELLLLVRKDSGIRSVRDLRGRAIAMPAKNPRCLDMYLAWLESLVMEEDSGDINAFFSSVKETRTAAKVVMPVFFKQADACVVTRQVFDLTTELNPQISKELMVISRKEKLAQGVIAVDRRVSEDVKEKIRQAFLTLHQTTEGKQLLMLFKVRKLIPYFPGYLKGTESLYAEHSRQRNMIAGRR